jgi:type I restriction enzyme S subunit
MRKVWLIVKLGEVLTRVERAETPQAGTTYRQIGVKLWGEGAYERKSMDGRATKYSRLFRAEAGDIIVNKIWARNGSVAVVSESLAGCYCSGEFPIFVPKGDLLESRWIHWLTKTREFWTQCDQKSQGTSGKNRIRPERFLEIEIRLPPLAEQRRVVSRIEELAALIKETRTLRSQGAQEAGALVVARSAEIFSAASRRGTVPLASVATLERGKFSHRPRNDSRFFGGAHPWIQIGEIEAGRKRISTWTETLNDEGLAISKKFPKGTVLISIAATIGSVGILDFDCCIPDSIVGVTPREETDSEFLYYYLTYIRGHLEDIAPQSAQKNINLQILSSLPIPALPLYEQRRIVEELDALQSEVRELQRLQAGTAAELDALLPSILDRAFKGEL